MSSEIISQLKALPHQDAPRLLRELPLAAPFTQWRDLRMENKLRIVQLAALHGLAQEHMKKAVAYPSLTAALVTRIDALSDELIRHTMLERRALVAFKQTAIYKDCEAFAAEHGLTMRMFCPVAPEMLEFL